MTLNELLVLDAFFGEATPDQLGEVLESKGLNPLDPGPSIGGFLAKRKSFYYYGVNSTFPAKKKQFGIAHEGTHFALDHISHPGFMDNNGFHYDHVHSFSGYKVIVSTEKDANIGAADRICDTQVTLDMMGYDRTDVIAYRNSVKSFDKTLKAYRAHFEIVVSNNASEERRIRRMEEYKERLTRMYYELLEHAEDISNSNICLTKPEMAAELGVPEYIIDLKCEALRIRNYDVPDLELPSFTKVFRDWH